MSIDIEILPTMNKQISWAELKELIFRNVPDAKRSLLHDLKLVDAKDNRSLLDSDLIQSDRGYIFDSECITTLTLVTIEKDKAFSDKEVIEDFGCNLSLDERVELLNKWEKIPYSFMISSGANRSITEAELMGCIGAGVADACKGRVIVAENKFFNLAKGIYSSEECAQIRPRT